MKGLSVVFSGILASAALIVSPAFAQQMPLREAVEVLLAQADLVTKEVDIAVQIIQGSSFSLLVAAVTLPVQAVLVMQVLGTAKRANHSLRGSDALQVAALQVVRDFFCFYP